jgi:hypothetical protein
MLKRRVVTPDMWIGKDVAFKPVTPPLQFLRAKRIFERLRAEYGSPAASI